MTPVTAPLPAPAAPLASTPVVDTFNPADLDRLRELIQSTAAQTVNPAGMPLPAGPTAPVANTTRTWGDTVLEGVLRFGNNYQHSMHAIETRLQDVVRSEGAGLTNFSEILALQIDVSKWSMSVMGVDNASKAGSNTIKELSRGG